MRPPVTNPDLPLDGPDLPRKVSWTRWGLRVLGIITVTYLILVGLLFWFQEKLIFPGSVTQGKETMRVSESQNTQIVSLSLSDGTPVVARYDLTHRQNPDHAPVVLLFYGNGQCAKTTGGVIYLFTQMGFNVLTPDYPGYGMSGGKPSERAFYETAEVCWNYLTGVLKRPVEQIHVVGWSLGTGVVIDLVSRHTPATLTTISAYTSMTEMASRTAPFFPTRLLLKHRFDNLSKIGNVRCPILMIHGTQDRIIPVQMTRKLASEARVRLRTFYPQTDHNDIFDVRTEDLMIELYAHLNGIPSAFPYPSTTFISR